MQKLIAYLDETGDHQLDPIDKEFPIFVLTLLICNDDEYINRLVPSVYQLKMDYFHHEGVILHSRDIRKAKDFFSFLLDPTKRFPFYERINTIIRDNKFTIISSVIQKERLKHNYVKPFNPYELGLLFALERLVILLEENNQNEIYIIAEARGKKEDDELRLSFYQTTTKGTSKVKKERFQKIQFHLEFKPKSMNIVGTQIADLAGYPIARKMLNPDKPNPAFEIVKTKIFSIKGEIKGTGLKFFP